MAVYALQPRYVPCPECGGDGHVTYERAVPASFSNPYGYYLEYEATCDNCSGSGEIEADADDE